jgi:aspartate/methionine/tyrosine aminotransferase
MARLVAAEGGTAVNLAQGFPDFPCPPELKEAAKTAIDADVNQYAITWGAADFRAAVAEKAARVGASAGPSRPPEMTDAIRKVHDFLTVGAAAPLQAAGVAAMQLPASYYDELAIHYRSAVTCSAGCSRRRGSGSGCRTGRTTC